MKVEFIKCHEDGTWDTEVLEVPNQVVSKYNTNSPKWDHAVIRWCAKEVGSQVQHRKVLFWGIYNSDPEDREV